MPTLRQSPQLLQTQIMKVSDTNQVTEFRDLCFQHSPLTLLPTFPAHCQ